MELSEGNRTRLGALVLTVALGACALLALPGLGIGKDNPPGGEPAGTIESFDPETSQLVIDLAKGDTISALVTRQTHVRCGEEDRGRHGRRHSMRRGGSGDERSERCRDQLIAGAPVKGAVIVLAKGNAAYKDIGLVPSPSPGPEGEPSDEQAQE